MSIEITKQGILANGKLCLYSEIMGVSLLSSTDLRLHTLGETICVKCDSSDLEKEVAEYHDEIVLALKHKHPARDVVVDNLTYEGVHIRKLPTGISEVFIPDHVTSRNNVIVPIVEMQN